MPIQRRLLGRPVTLQLPPRRFQIAFGLGVFLLVLIALSLQTRVPLPNVPTVADLSGDAQRLAELLRKPKLAKLYNPFAAVAHEPPAQANSSDGDTRWYSDLKWLNPFSSAVTLDDGRTVLPPINPRTPIYTFYDASGDKDADVIDAENKLLLIWRRAWWSQGFKPVVLGPPEAKKHPRYADIHKLKASTAFIQELDRWLAWAHMEGGILANYLALPMAHFEHSQLASLRKGEFDSLARYESLQSGLFTGRKVDVEGAIRHVLSKTDVVATKPTTIIDVLPNDAFKLDQDSNGVAYYEINRLISSYKDVVNKLSESKAAGLILLQQLINAHLHNTWQNLFPKGIAILQPLPRGKRPLISFSTELGRDLAQCPDSPLPNTCPPNRPHCRPCATSARIRFTYPESYSNQSSMFTIASVPHPFTFATLHHASSSLSAMFVRRSTPRDMWLAKATETLLARGISGPQRLPGFKEAVAGQRGRAQSIWLTAEREELVDFDWVFGFALPRSNRDGSFSSSNAPGAGAPGTGKHEVTVDAKADAERMLFEAAKSNVKKRRRPQVEMLEAWNMADVEAWRFVRAFQTRRRVERLKWEEEEKAFAGSESRSRGWGKWIGVGT